MAGGREEIPEKNRPEHSRHARDLAGVLGEKLGALLRLKPRNPFSPNHYMTLSYVLMLAFGMHILVALRFAPSAGITLYRLVGAGSSTPFVVAAEALAFLDIVFGIYPAFRIYEDRRLSFAYALYNVSSTLPYLNIIFIVLSSLEHGPRGITVHAGGLILAAIYAVLSIAIASMAGLSPFAIIELYKAKKTGEFTLVDAPPGTTIRYDEGDMFRLVYTGRTDRPLPTLLLGSRSAWEIRVKTKRGLLEALFRPLSAVEDTLSLNIGGRPIYRIVLRPLKPVSYAKPDTEIHIELIVPGEGGKTIRKIIVQRPGGVKLSSVLRDIIPSDLVIQRILRIEKGRYQPVKDLDKEVIKPKTLNRFVVETLPAGGKPKPAKPGKVAIGISASAPERAPAAPPISLAPQNELVAKVKRLIEEYSELREDLW